MNAKEAFQKTMDYNHPLEATLRGILESINYSVNKGEFYYHHNTCTPESYGLEALKELIKRYGYRIFIRNRKGSNRSYNADCNGYPSWFIYWGAEKELEDVVNAVMRKPIGPDKWSNGCIGDEYWYELKAE